LAIAGTQAGAWDAKLTPSRKAVVDAIDADALKAHVSFLASDVLGGRNTPSVGLDVSAEYIAAQFRRAGLDPAGDAGTYFQNTTYTPKNGTPGKVRNVAGILRGSDPKLRDTYILVTAHYDHVGEKTTGEGDLISNGANDNASGVATVIELANTMVKYKPKRSVVFMTFWGEEKGLLGATHYAKNPLVPISKTIANVNIEQVGRTDDSEGPRVGKLNMTGMDYSEVGAAFTEAGKTVGVPMERHPQYSDMFFFASDNAALAAVGIPAHTVSTAYQFPDYHKVGDHWDKLDYANMAKVVRLIGLGVMTLADSEREPKWAEIAKTDQYRKAWQEQRKG